MGDSNESYLMDCPNCGTPIIDSYLLEKLDSLETYRCVTCLSNISVLVNELTLTFPTVLEKFKVIISWQDRKLSATEVLAFRLLLPQYHQLSVMQMKKELDLYDKIEINNLTRNSAENLVEKAQEIGLATRIEQIEN